MFVRPSSFARRPLRSLQAVFLTSVSMATLLAVAAPAQAKGMLSVGIGAPAAAAQQAAMAAVSQAAAATAQARSSLARATQAIQLAQSAAHNLSLQAQNLIPDGLATGGLQVAPGVGSDPSLWQNADLPTQSQSGTQTLITIKQTAQKAIATWQSFNVSQNTTVHFDQTGGTQTDGSNDWVILNRIVDPSGVPSQIRGQIQAEGSVYLINRNGIIFGTGAQVDTHTLIASSLSFLGENITGLTPGSTAYDNAVSATNNTFLTAGIAQPESTDGGGNSIDPVLGQGPQLTVPSAAAYQAPGDIEIDEGASITTHGNGAQGNGGYVLIAGTNVSNAGMVSTPDGQAILAAGIGVNFSTFGTNSGSTARLTPIITGRILANGQDITPVSTLTNTETGLVEAQRGTIDLLGTNVAQNGVVVATTGVSYPGNITINALDERLVSVNQAADFSQRAGVVSFGPGSVTANLPEEDGETATSSPTSSFTPGSVSITGGSVTFQNGSLLEAPGAKVTVAAQVENAFGTAVSPPGDTAVPGRLYIDNGATIDVAGLSDVELPVADTLFTIPIITLNELADSPLQRAGFLLNQKNLVLDSTLSGTTADGLAWVGSPLLNASGYAQLIPRLIDQLLTNAGSITLAGNEVITAPGSSLNLDGGYVHYLGGIINTTMLVDASGHKVAIGNADPNDTFTGIAGQFTVDHTRWGITETYGSGLAIGGGTYEQDYIQGGNAGTLTVYGQSAEVLDGAMSAQVVSGLKQQAAGRAPAGTVSGGSFLPMGGTFDLGDGGNLAQASEDATFNQTANVIIQDAAPALTGFDPDFSADTPFDAVALGALDPSDPNNVLAWQTVPAAALSAGGFANVKLNLVGNTNATGRDLVVAQGTTLTLQPGGSLTYKAGFGGDITVLGSIVIPSGTINLETDSVDTSGIVGPSQNVHPGSITLGPDGVLSTAGTWVNDSGLTSAPGADAFVNGGSVILSAGLGADIDLEQGSLIDVSSGGVLLANGLLMKNGVPVGQGGNVTLSTWNFHLTNGFDHAEPPVQPTTGRLILDGTIRSAGFAGGGTLTLQGLGFQIGGDASSAPTWDVVLPADFFATQGFGNYQIKALYDTTIADGTQVRLTQQNLMPDLSALANAPSGTSIAGLVGLGTLDAYYRQATDLTLTAGGALAWTNGFGPFEQYDGVSNKVLLGVGAAIDADAGASVTLDGLNGVTVLGTIRAPGGSIALTGDIFTTSDQAVWLGSDAVLDVSGVALVNPFAKPVDIGGILAIPTTGKVLDGGNVTLSDAAGYVIAEAGSLIDVSGTAASFDQLQATGGYAPQPVWSDAGSITLGANAGLFFDGTLEGQAGAALAEGGTLTLLPETLANGGAATYTGGTSTAASAKGLIIQQSGSLVPTGLAPGQAITDADADTIRFSADRLNGSGITTLVLGGPSSDPNASPIIAFAGDVNLSLGRAVVINSSQILALRSGTTSMPALADGTTDTGGARVSITAPYVELAGRTNISGGGGTPIVDTTDMMAGDATLAIDAGFLDLTNQVALDNVGTANLTSSGDIRLSSTGEMATGPSLNVTVIAPGLLYTSGDLNLKAADLYPASGESFILDAVGPNPTTISFESNGASSTPLSAGGTLLVDATNIVQGGTIKVPFGSITLGIGDPTDAATQAAFDSMPLVATQNVTLAAGSLTSVSAGQATLPYGTTTDGSDWTYPEVPNSAAAPNLTAPPAKIVTLNGVAVSLDTGATVDLSGGGTLQAEEWVPGTGGTRDLLSQYNISYASSTAGATVPLYPDVRNVYAVLPGYTAPVAAYDPVFAQIPNPASQGFTTSLGVGQAGAGDLVGQAVYLSGVPGLANGVYTLLPAKYATLPGAFRVVQNTSATNVVPGQSVTASDGTQVVSGYYVDALSGARNVTPVQFQVQSAAVWGQYSQYSLTNADSYFASAAATAGTATPALPQDAGQLVLAATSALHLGAVLDTQAAPGGAAALVDIASQDIEITGSGEPALAGYLQISAGDLDALDAGSLLIGGTRRRTTSGMAIDVAANSVVVANDAADPLTGPEILLVAKSDPSGADPNAGNGLWVQSGSVIAAKGSLPASTDQTLLIGDDTHSGDGALLRVSDGGQVAVVRSNIGATPQGVLTVAAGASIDGGAALTLDSSGNLSFDPAARFAGTEIAVDASTITFTDADAAGLAGFVVGPDGLAQFADASQVDLRSFGDMVFAGDVDVAFGQSVELSAGRFVGDGQATITGSTIAFTNDLGASTDNGIAGSGSLTVNAVEIDLASGNKGLSGFGTVAMTATAGIIGQATGSFNLGAAGVALAAPVFLADTGSATSLTTTGALVLSGNSGTGLGLSPVGGALSFTGGSVAVNGATLSAPAGNLTLEATTGDLTIAEGSTLGAAGVAKQFFDTTQYAPAGYIHLTADTGLLDVQAGSTLDFSGAQGGGNAGSLVLSAPVQAVQLAGTIKGNAAPGYTGGSLSLDTGGATDLDNLATLLLTSGVDDAITIHSRAGNLVLSAGNTLSAHLVSLTADGGAGGQDPNNGNVVINGTINANGAAGGAGGEIDLYGKSGVELDGTLLARGADAYNADGSPNMFSLDLGGTVNIGTTAVFDPGEANPYNTTYGYENISAAQSGAILLGANARIDVSGGGLLTLLLDGKQGGTVNLRAPLLANGGVNVTIAPTTQIIGSRATTLEAYAMWSTTDATTGAQHFDGIVDPAGWYDASGTLLAGSFTNSAGATTMWDGTALINFAVPATTTTSTAVVNGTTTTVTYSWDNSTYTLTSTTTVVIPAGTSNAGTTTTTATVFSGLPGALNYLLANDYFTPTASNTDPSRTAHETFYGYVNGDYTTAAPGTLMGFVQSGVQGVATQFAGTGVTVVPGIELDNPSTAINGGNITVLTNWNLGSGSNASHLDFRFNGQAPVITFKAENDFQAKASLSDGFFQIDDPTTADISVAVPSRYESDGSTPLQYSDADLLWTEPSGYYASFGIGLSYYGPAYARDLAFAPQMVSGSPDEVAEYYALYTAYAETLNSLVPANGFVNGSGTGTVIHEVLLAVEFGQSGAAPPPAPAAPTASSSPADQAAYPENYLLYLVHYKAYVDAAVNAVVNNQIPFFIGPPDPPAAQPIALISGSSITDLAPRDDTPSPVPSSLNSLPMAAASLNPNGGSSSSFRIVAGAGMTSANPLFAGNDSGNVTLDGHFSVVDTNNETINVPTMIRTGTGSIDIVAANDVSLLDQTAPGVIYTAGAPAAGAPFGSGVSILTGGAFSTLPDLVATDVVNPDAAGDISIAAGNDILGVESVGTGESASSQFWWRWMQTGNARSNGQVTQSSINFGAFDQGVMSVGGNVDISAGRNIQNLAVSLPTSWYLSNGLPATVGGGDLSVTAGGDILAGDYFVARGTGTITAGGQIASGGLAIVPQFGGQPLSEVSTILGLQDGALNVTARQGADIGAVVNPSYVQAPIYDRNVRWLADSQSYSGSSSVSIAATTGDATLNSLQTLGLIGATDPGQSNSDDSYILPPTVALTAFSGGIEIDRGGELYPSAIGQLSLIADQSIQLDSIFGATNFSQLQFGLIDAAPSALPSPLDPMLNSGGPVFGLVDADLTSPALIDHSPTPLHAGDTQPVRIYSLDGSIVDGSIDPSSGFYSRILTIAVDKPAQIYAGQDIINLNFLGQNLREDDITRIVAGRDIAAVDQSLNVSNPDMTSLNLGGPGLFDIEAGRNIDIANASELTAAQAAAAAQAGAQPSADGIIAVGNSNNPYLPHESADVNVLFGVGKGVDNAAFIQAYVDPAFATPEIGQALVTFMEDWDEGQGIDTGLIKDRTSVALSLDQAWSQFQTLPAAAQQDFNREALFMVLAQVGVDYNDRTSPFYHQYARGYQAINTLFPASMGYTANSLAGGVQGAQTLVHTGDLDMRSSTIQTQQGGNISILGPGGEALVGGNSAPPASGKSAATQGILTLEQGGVDIFTDTSVLLAQSRIFTEQGGAIMLWSSNGDINAGKGSKTTADVPPPIYVCSSDFYCTRDARGEVSGAGIATLQTIPGAPTADVETVAPRGTVDFGAAGVRSSGNLIVAAFTVANAANAQVQGDTIGVPKQAGGDVSPPPTDSTAADAAAAAAQVVRQGTHTVQDLPSIITVEVIGYGGGDGTPASNTAAAAKRPDHSDDRKKSPNQQSRQAASESNGLAPYNTASAVQVLGSGALTPQEDQYLTAEERRRLAQP